MERQAGVNLRSSVCSGDALESGSSFIHLLFCPASLNLVSEISEPGLAAPPRPSWMQQSWVSSAPKGQVSEPRPL